MMWDGSFSPSVRKDVTIGNVSFIPLAQMTNEDWTWLDYDNLRNVARNRIADAIVGGILTGFFDVNLVTEKAKGWKPRYLWPATHGDKAKFDNGDLEGKDFFGNEKETPVDSLSSNTVENRRSYLMLTTSQILAIMVQQLIDHDDNEDNKSQLQQITVNHLESLDANFRDLLILAVMYWSLTDEQVQSILDIVESDNSDLQKKRLIQTYFDELHSNDTALAAARVPKVTKFWASLDND